MAARKSLDRVDRALDRAIERCHESTNFVRDLVEMMGVDLVARIAGVDEAAVQRLMDDNKRVSVDQELRMRAALFGGWVVIGLVGSWKPRDWILAPDPVLNTSPVDMLAAEVWDGGLLFASVKALI